VAALERTFDPASIQQQQALALRHIRHNTFGQTPEFTMTSKIWKDRRYFIGSSDARIIMGDDEAALLRLWREKRSEVEPKDLSSNLVVHLE
jgi:predicted phage-related endonuclease